ncbi:MAG: hypothetical protein OT477_14505 [Chloroflexi bacterium]|nr:hypothetical protein [Chloroflexota bacterium]
MIDPELHKIHTLLTHLAAYGPLTLAQEQRLRQAAVALVHSIELTLHERQGQEVALSPHASRVALFEMVVRPFFQKILPHLSQLQNSFSFSQSWFGYQTEKQAVQDVFTLEKLGRVIKNEAELQRVMLVSHMRKSHHRPRTAPITRVSIIFSFDGSLVHASYKVEDPAISPIEVHMFTADYHQPLSEEALDKLIIFATREIRTIVWENNF